MPETELGSDYYLSAKRLECLTYEFFIGKWSIYFGSIKEGDTPLNCITNHCNHLFPRSDRTIAKAHSHAAQSEGGYFQAAFAKFSLLHSFASCPGKYTESDRLQFA